jgi:hypothetical protein
MDPPADLYASSAASGHTALGLKLAVTDFTDATNRLRPTLVGSALTGMSNAGADVLATEPGTTTVTNAFRKAAMGVGFELADRERADMVATGEVTRFWIEELTSGSSGEFAHATVAFTVTFTSQAGKELWTRAVEGHAQTPPTLLDITKDDGKTLERALLDAIQKVFAQQSLWDVVAAARDRTKQPAISSQ